MTSDDSQIPTTIFLCVHRGGSSFIAGALAETILKHQPALRHIRIGSEIEAGHTHNDFALTPNHMLVTRVYPADYACLVEAPVPPQGRFTDKKLIMIRRDPRDAAVSWYYSAAYSHPVPATTALWYEERRRHFRSIGPRDGIREDTAGRAIREFRLAQQFIEHHPQTLDVPYELMVEDQAEWAARVARYLEWRTALRDEVHEVMGRELVGPASEDPHRHRRRVRPGNWADVFDEDLCDLFRRELGNALEAAGYGW